MVEENLWDWPLNNLSKLKPMPREGAQTWHCLEGQEPEAGQPRNTDENQTSLERHYNEMITNDILLYY